MVKVIGVRFKSSGKVYYFDPGDYEVNQGDSVIVETSRGVEFGDVVNGIQEVQSSDIVMPLKQILRVATSSDRDTLNQNNAKQEDAFAICEEKIEKHKLDMKLIDVEYSFNGAKITFFFTADGRVDFRELVKDLASVFRTRIELRQIGVRDEARMIGGLGGCGRAVCCKQFLSDFHPVSIKMAKEQNLSLSPTKISGICGRLMCCLKYEQETYEALRKEMPRVGREILTPDGIGVVISNQVIAEKSKVRLTMPDGTIELREYPIAELKKIRSEMNSHSAKDRTVLNQNEKIDLIDENSLPEIEDSLAEIPVDLEELLALEDHDEEDPRKNSNRKARPNNRRRPNNPAPRSGN